MVPGAGGGVVEAQLYVAEFPGLDSLALLSLALSRSLAFLAFFFLSP